MKTVLRCTVLALVLFAVTAASAQIQHEIELTRSEIQADRQKIVAANLPLSEAQATAFWPAYREYRNELAKLGDRFVALIESYAKTYETMTDAQAKAMLEEMFAIQGEELKIKKSWQPKFEKILPAKAVARFYQIENKLDAIIRVELAAEVPLVEHGVK